MKTKTNILLLSSAAFVTLLTSVSAADRWVTQNAQISFFSSTPAEDIQANNNSVVVVVDAKENSLGFSVPMQAFEFEKRTMQKHFNQKKFLNTKEFPQATFKGTIDGEVDFEKEGDYEVSVSGKMTIHGVEQDVTQNGTIKVSGNKVSLHSVFDLTLADYDVVFKSGKPSKNIAKTVKITVNADDLEPAEAAGA